MYLGGAVSPVPFVYVYFIKILNVDNLQKGSHAIFQIAIYP